MPKKQFWIKRHINDPYVKEAQRLGYASRAAFKLSDIQKRDKIFKPGMTVIDLGAAPGGWSQVASHCVGKTGRIIAIDLLPIKTIQNTTSIQGDLNDNHILQQLQSVLHGKKVDVIISDLSPNLSGQKAIDLPKSIHLLEMVLDTAHRFLKPGGTLLMKVFQGAGLDEFMLNLKLYFSGVKYRKPGASRPESTERYVLAIDFHDEYNR